MKYVTKQLKFPTSEKIVRGFWEKLPRTERDGRPFFALAPMADVTDNPFREMIAKYSRMGEKDGGPDVIWTEFVATGGLTSIAKEKMLRDFEYTERQRPIVAQIFGHDPDKFFESAQLCTELGFDGIDINMGCPADVINNQCAGAALIKDPELAKEIVRATIAGAKHIPVSVKTRIGWTHDQTEEWIGSLLETRPALITIHARTRSEMSKSEPKWGAVARAMVVAKRRAEEYGDERTLIVANGSILTREQGEMVAQETGCDGIMIGKSVFGTPWFFDRKRIEKPSVRERLAMMIEHTQLFCEWLSDEGPDSSKKYFQFGKNQKIIQGFQRSKNFSILKKHYKAYVSDFDGAKELRIELMEAETLDEIEERVAEFLATFPGGVY